MDFVKLDRCAIITTDKKFLLVLDDEMAGPFPNTKEMFNAVLNLLENPDDDEAAKECYRLKREKK